MPDNDFMAIDIDTTTIRRLRDALITNGRLETSPDERSDKVIEDRLQASMARAAPFVETMYLVMVADGHEQESEKEAILGAVSMLTHGCLNVAELEKILHTSKQEIARQGVEGRLQVIGAQISADRQDREIAFTLAAATALA
ncbi:MAG: hypothetical protein KJN90_09175, partial [Gammaproteobacteria bacterium]|nr:hypothetical protein [Gammaproteobacteria bacterium]